MVRVLHIVGSMDRNGLQTYIMNVYRNIDREKVQFDFIEFRSAPCDYDEEIEKLGGRIYRLPAKSTSIVKCLMSIAKIVKEGNYKIVERHYYSASMVLELIAAKCGGAKKLIAHSHSTRALHRSYMHYLFRPLLNRVANVKLACSDEAGRWMYKNKEFQIINNGIDEKRYAFNESLRMKIREQIQASSCFVIGNVARFDRVKNHEFMIELVERYRSINASAKLVLIGDGERFELIKKLVENKGLSNCVVFIGNVHDVYAYLNAFDVFILPSLYEGIPLTVIEAQANGLSCILSDTVDRKTNITGNVEYIGIAENDIQKWCDAFEKIREDHSIRKDSIQVARDLEKAKYSVSHISKELQDNLYII